MATTRDDAIGWLARRDRTRHEIEERLRARGHDEGAIVRAVADLMADGRLDDRALARRWIAAQGRGRGPDRTRGELLARGIDPGVVEAAWREAVSEGDWDGESAVLAAVRRRVGAHPVVLEKARIARVYTALLSEGFEPEHVASALLPYGFERTDV